MFSSLTRFDSVTAAGILARMALCIEDDGNPACEERVPNEAAIRAAVLQEAYKAIGLSPEDRSCAANEKLAELLDQESDTLLDLGDPEETLGKLGSRGELPSDLYRVQINLEVARFYGARYLAEEARIKEAVRSPDMEQHYGESKEEGKPVLISLFAKHFTDSKFSLRSFTLLVAGQRSGRNLNVVQVWRIYGDVVDTNNISGLVTLLERFAEVFGISVNVNGKQAKFFLSEDIDGSVSDITTSIDMPLTKAGGELRANIVQFVQTSPSGRIEAALVVAIDIAKYQKLLKTRGW